jgi:hypothetical protein
MCHKSISRPFKIVGSILVLMMGFAGRLPLQAGEVSGKATPDVYTPVQPASDFKGKTPEDILRFNAESKGYTYRPSADASISPAAATGCTTPEPAPLDPCPGNSSEWLPAGFACPSGYLNCGVHQADYRCSGNSWIPYSSVCCALAKGGDCGNPTPPKPPTGCTSPAPAVTDPCPGTSMGFGPAETSCQSGFLDCGAHAPEYICLVNAWVPRTLECCANPANGGRCSATNPSTTPAGCPLPVPASIDPCPGNSKPWLPAGMGCQPGYQRCGIHNTEFACTIFGTWTPAAHECCALSADQGGSCGGSSQAVAVPSPAASECFHNNLCGLTTYNKCQGSGPAYTACPCVPCSQ